jgi:uncharacterized membrane protein
MEVLTREGLSANVAFVQHERAWSAMLLKEGRTLVKVF